MHTPLFMQGLYVLMLAGSAALVLYAALVALRHLYPSLKLFYPESPVAEHVPYGAMLAVVVLCFGFAAYVTPATIMAGLALLMLAGWHSVKPLPPMALPLAAFIGAGLALLAEAEMLQEGGLTPMRMALAAGFVAAPVLASMAPSKGAVNVAALGALALVAVGGLAIGGVMTQSFAHGGAAAAVVAAGITVMLAYVRKNGGSIGPGGVIGPVMIAAHSALLLGVHGQVYAGLAMMAGVLFAAGIAASGRAVR